MKKVLFGPVSNAPSWEWVGKDIAESLKTHYEVEFFTDKITPADAIFVIKKPLNAGQLRDTHGSKIIYIPVDYFTSHGHIYSHRKFLQSCSIIGVHCDKLKSHLGKFALTHNVEHYLKYPINPTPYKENGFVLWIGVYETLPFFIKYLQTNPIANDIKILTNLSNKSAVGRSHKFQAHYNIDLNNIPFKLYDWTPELQAQMMSEAKAAIEIKDGDFIGSHKPPTKAQQFIANGIPLACKGYYATNYFKKYGFSIPEPNDYWLSKKYWEKTQEMAKVLRRDLSLENVRNKYIQFIEANEPQIKTTTVITKDSKIKKNALTMEQWKRIRRSLKQRGG